VGEHAVPEILPEQTVHPSITDPEPRSRWLTAKQAARHANVSTKTIYQAVRSGRLRAALIGGRRSKRFLVAWIDAWLEAEATPIEVTRAAALRIASR